jgi:hypothetical protein
MKGRQHIGGTRLRACVLLAGALLASFDAEGAAASDPLLPLNTLTGTSPAFTRLSMSTIVTLSWYCMDTQP